MSDLIRNITEITRCGVQYRTETLAPLDLKACHASYLRQICADPGISQDTLASRICINKSNVARQAAALEEGGFIRRTPSTEDKRVMCLFPTDKTLALLPQLNAILDAWEDRLTGDIAPEELAIAAHVLELMKRKAAAWIEP